MTVKEILAHQIGRLATAFVGLTLSLGLVFIGGTFENAIALSAGALALFASVGLVSLDLALFLRSTNRIIEMAEPIYARERLRLESRASSTGWLENSDDAWVREIAFIEADAAASVASGGEPIPSMMPTPLTPKAVKFGNIEFRTYENDGLEAELERLERISKEAGPTGLRKKLLIARVGTALVDESSLGDYVEGHLSFKQLAFPEILPGFDLLASDDALKFRRPSTWKEAIQRAAGDYDRTIVIVEARELRGYQDLMNRDSRVIVLGT